MSLQVAMRLASFDKKRICLMLLTTLYLLGNANAECNPFDLSVTADDYMILLVDGAPITGLQNAINWHIVDRVTLTCASKVIAIQGINARGVGAIRACDDAGNIVTNSSWKCTDVAYRGWEKVDFDDSSWPEAIVINASTHHIRPGSNQNCKWIWSQTWSLPHTIQINPNENAHAYCRKLLAVNECALDPPYNQCNSSTGTCEDTPNGYNCRCFNGYRNRNSQTCEDIDECQQDSVCTGPAELCVNLPGSYKCVSCRNNVCNNPQIHTQAALSSEQTHTGPGVAILSTFLVLSVLMIIALTTYLVWRCRA